MERLYRGMDRATLDRAYDNTRAVADFPAVLADFRRRSAQLYARVGGRREVRYGERPRERFDWLSCGRAGAPRFVFIHGGYWQNCAKEDFAFVADGPLAAGFDVVLAEYTLAPEASMTQIVGEIARLLDRLSADRDGLGGAGRPLCLSGHSAGGHLSAVHRGHACVTSTLAISPLVDLEPISLSWLNDKLRLSEREIADYSPLFHVGKGAPTIVAVGAHELPELVRHADDYAHACAAAGEPVRRVHNDQTFSSAPRRVRDHLPEDEAAARLRQRFAIINVWRALDVVERLPLALCDARTIAPDDLVPSDLVYRDKVGETYSVVANPAHRWFYFPRLRADEVLLLKIYDSLDDGRARLSAHTAFDDPTTPDTAAPRRSIEVRALVFWPAADAKR